MSHYRAIIHYHFKKGLEERGMRLCQKELVNKAQELGCHSIELWRNERDPAYVIGIAAWVSIEDVRRCQALWDMKEQEILRYCTHSPKRDFFQVAAIDVDRSMRVA